MKDTRYPWDPLADAGYESGLAEEIHKHMVQGQAVVVRPSGQVEPSIETFEQELLKRMAGDFVAEVQGESIYIVSWTLLIIDGTAVPGLKQAGGNPQIKDIYAMTVQEFLEIAKRSDGSPTGVNMLSGQSSKPDDCAAFARRCAVTMLANAVSNSQQGDV